MSGRCGESRRRHLVQALALGLSGRLTVGLTGGLTGGLTVGLAGGLAGGLTGCAAPGPQAQTPPDDALWHALAPGLWWAPGAAAEPDEHNRGQVAHLLALQTGGRLWVLGSGPSPARGRQLALALGRLAGQAATDVVNPWASPALVLGNRGWAAAAPAMAPAPRLWAHVQVAQALALQCPRCVARLRAQLSAAATDLGAAPVQLPAQVFDGDSGHLAGGLLRWWTVDRGAGSVCTLWAVPHARLLFAPGLLWTDAPPDLADCTLAGLQAATALLLQRLGRGWRVLGQQGPLAGHAALQAQAHYLDSLARTVRARQAQGALEAEPPAPLADVSAAWQQHPRHALNWQRVWRALDEAAMDTMDTMDALDAQQPPA